MAPKFDPFKAKPLSLDGDNPLLNKGAPLPDIKPSPAAPTPKTNTADIDILDSYGIVGGYYDCNVSQNHSWTKLIDISTVPRKSQPLTLTIDMRYFDGNFVVPKGGLLPADYCVKIEYGNEFSEHVIYVDVRNGESISLTAAHMKVFFGVATWGIPTDWVPPGGSHAPAVPAALGANSNARIGAFVCKGAYGTGRPTRTNLFWQDIPGLGGFPGGLVIDGIPELARTVQVVGRGSEDREVLFIGPFGYGTVSRIGSYYIGANQDPPTLVIPGGTTRVCLRTPTTSVPAAHATLNPARGNNDYLTFAIFELGL